MTVLLAIFVMSAPFAIAASLSWAVNRSALRARVDQFRVPSAAWGRLLDTDRDTLRIDHDVDAIRTRFEQTPVWPSSGAVGERR